MEGGRGGEKEGEGERRRERGEMTLSVDYTCMHAYTSLQMPRLCRNVSMVVGSSLCREWGEEGRGGVGGREGGEEGEREGERGVGVDEVRACNHCHSSLCTRDTQHTIILCRTHTQMEL